MTVWFNRLAAEEYRGAVRWYERRSRGAAERFVAAMRSAILAIREHPNRWPVLVGNYRHLPLDRFPYSIIFRPRGEQDVEIVAIAHASRRPGYWRQRQ